MSESIEAPDLVSASVRRHDLDWVRVLAFWLLILFHVAIAFVPWPVYAYRNRSTAGPWLEVTLDWMHQWRLPVLFLISGMGTSFAFRRRTGWGFVKERFGRLLVPLAFGTLVVNAPIVFFAFKRVDTPLSELPGFVWDYWLGFDWLGGLWIEGAAHLWFLRNLFVYSVVLAPVFVFLRNHPDGLLPRSVKKAVGLGNGVGLLLLVPLPLIGVELLIKPWAAGLVGRGYEFWWYLGLFAIGYALILAGELFWEALARLRFVVLGVGVLTWLVMSDLVADAEAVATLYGFAVENGGWTEYGFPFWGATTFPAAVLHSLNTWAWSLVVFAWAARFLNKPSRPLAHLNQSVYPFYIVHMTIILVVLWYVRLWYVWWPVAFAFLTVVTFGGCWAAFELTKRTKPTRVLFGIKPLRADPRTPASAGSRAANSMTRHSEV